MNKLQMAHEWAIETMRKDGFQKYYMQETVRLGWEYADAMQAEADKRKSKPELPSLQQTFIDGVEQPRYAPPCEEWQPDWSQAPCEALTWAINSDGYASWALYKDGHYFSTVQAPPFNYPGNWQESLRKRPQ
jgi:hypothetical protein